MATPHKGRSTGWVVKTLTFHKGKNFMKPDRDKKLKSLTLLSCAFPLQLATRYSVSLADVTFLKFLMANLSHFGVLPGQRRRWWGRENAWHIGAAVATTHRSCRRWHFSYILGGIKKKKKDKGEVCFSKGFLQQSYDATSICGGEQFQTNNIMCSPQAL